MSFVCFKASISTVQLLTETLSINGPFLAFTCVGVKPGAGGVWSHQTLRQFTDWVVEKDFIVRVHGTDPEGAEILTLAPLNSIVTINGQLQRSVNNLTNMYQNLAAISTRKP